MVCPILWLRRVQGTGHATRRVKWGSAIACVCLPVRMALAEPAPFVGVGQAPPHMAVRLRVDRGPGLRSCPDDDEVTQALAVQFGYDVVQSTAAERLVITLSRKGQDKRAELRYFDATGRVRWGDHYTAPVPCDRLLQGAVFVARVGMDLVQATDEAQRRRDEEKKRQADLVPKVQPKPALARSPGPKLRAGVGGGISLGHAPVATGDLSAEVGLRWASTSLSGEARFGLAGKDKRLSSSVMAGAAVPCGHYAFGLACGVVALGTLRVTALDAAAPATGLFFGVGGRLGAELPLAFLDKGLVVRMAGEVLANPIPWTVRVNGIQQWGTPAASGTFGVEIILTIF